MKIGVLISFNMNTDIQSEFKKLRELNMNCCQLCCWDSELYTQKNAEIISSSASEMSIEITALWAGWSGPCEWNFYYGPSTLGLVPAAYRFQRLKELYAASDFAEKINVTDIVTHVGFLPENPDNTDFIEVVAALRNLAAFMKTKGQYFLFETGQETPVTMLRTIEEVGTDNLGINFDTANLILYGKANSCDAIDIFGKYIRNIHLKDGEYPTDGKSLGIEKPLGEGRANIPLILKKLNALGYNGPLIIEREITGEQQIKDIIAARNMIIRLTSELNIN